LCRLSGLRGLPVGLQPVVQHELQDRALVEGGAQLRGGHIGALRRGGEPDVRGRLALTVRGDTTPGSVQPSIDLAFSLLFLAEFTLRCWDAPSRRDYVRAHWIDLLTCIPFVGGLRAMRLLRLLRLGAAFRVLTTIEGELADGSDGRGSLWFVAPCLLVLWIGSAYGAWLLEHGVNPHIASFGDALYWSFTTVTTVGYGDLTPVTAGGRLLSGALAFVGLGLLGFASARLTAMWLKQDTTIDATAQQLAALRTEDAELRQLLRERNQQPAHQP
jgi:hypothetical protein